MKLSKTSITIITVLSIIALSEMIYSLAMKTAGECATDSDCVEAACCHSASCVPSDFAPSCGDIMCSQECAPNTLDCGQGSCVCDKGKCSAVMK